MADSRDLLLKLIRIAMGWEDDYTLPEDIDWAQVLDMASEQGVAAIILDGYEVLIQKNPDVKEGLSSPKNKKLLLQAIGQVPIIEANYNQHVVALKELGNVLNKAGVPFVLMKGFACGQYYPNPKHRPCGDIDIYLGESFANSNEALKTAGIGVDMHYYRHSVSYVKDVMVENHRVLCDLRGPRKQTRDLEKQLEREAELCLYSGQQAVVDGEVISGAKFPTADFNALFLPWHVSAHFSLERVTIRHLLDWALFLTNDGKDIDIEKFRKAKKLYTFGFSKFADILTALALKYLKMPMATVPLSIVEDAYKADGALVSMVFDYMFVGQPRERVENLWRFRCNNIKRVWLERWKYKELYGMGVGRFLIHKMYGVIFRVGDDE